MKNKVLNQQLGSASSICVCMCSNPESAKEADDNFCLQSFKNMFCQKNIILTLKAPNKNCSRQHFNFLLLSFEENKA